MHEFDRYNTIHMAKSPALPKTEKTDTTAVEKKSQPNEYVELKLPKLRFQDTPLSPLWVILLLVFSFLLGMSTMKLMYSDEALEKVLAQANNQQGTDPSQPSLGAQVDIDAGDLPLQGNKNAKITIVEFSDFQCPYCKRFYDETYAQIKKEYVDSGKVNLAYRHMPLASHPLAQDAGEASECANEQGAFWAYHDKLFENFNDWASLTNDEAITQYVTIAGDLGLNTEEFESCLISDKHDQTVKDDLAAGSTAGVSGTPTFFINGKPLVGAHPFQTFKTLIDQELKNL